MTRDVANQVTSLLAGVEQADLLRSHIGFTRSLTGNEAREPCPARSYLSLQRWSFNLSQ